LEVCIRRDPKGLYRRALDGQVARLIDYPFDAPRPEEKQHRIDTVAENVDECAHAILAVAEARLHVGTVETSPPLPNVPAAPVYSI
jgi:adenylylsulfate kinase-like enzyme